jgi:hypothetical protein
MIIHMTCTRMLPSPTSPTSLTGERGLLRRRWQRRITSGALRQAGVGPLHIRDQSHSPPPPAPVHERTRDSPENTDWRVDRKPQLSIGALR